MRFRRKEGVGGGGNHSGGNRGDHSSLQATDTRVYHLFLPAMSLLTQPRLDVYTAPTCTTAARIL